jgi:hypothetical protein
MWQHAEQYAGASGTSNSSSSSSQLSLPSLTNLTSLTLMDMVYGLAGGLSALTALTRLQQLQCGDLYPQLPPPAHMPNGLVIKMHALWPPAHEKLQHGMLLCLSAWTQLTSIDMDPALLPEDAVGPSSRLQQLQVLQLAHDGVQSPATLAGLSPSLRALQLTWGAAQSFSSSTCSALAGLTAMQHLKVLARDAGSGELSLSCCSSMRQLRELQLRGEFDANAVNEMLAVMPGLSLLEDLELRTGQESFVLPAAADVAKYASFLPASPHLKRVEITWTESPLLVPGCGQHLFPGRQLPHLTELVLGVPCNARHDIDYSDDDLAAMVREMPQPLGVGDVSRLVACCPALRMLWIAGLVQPWVDMSPLLQLTQLYDLCIGGEVVDNNVATKVLAQMPQLEHLQVFCAPQLTDTGVLALVALTNVVKLVACETGCSGEMSEDGTIPDLVSRLHA